MEKLDQARIRRLLEKADDKWFVELRKKGNKFDYHTHLDFTAEYIAGNYHRGNNKK